MPNSIKTLEQFNKWVDTQNTNKTDLEIRTKFKENGTQAFSVISKHPTKGDRVHYLITDGYSSGCAYVKNFNRSFNFVLRVHE